MCEIKLRIAKFVKMNLIFVIFECFSFEDSFHWISF